MIVRNSRSIFKIKNFKTSSQNQYQYHELSWALFKFKIKINSNFDLFSKSKSRTISRIKIKIQESRFLPISAGHHPFASGQHHFASGENNCKKFFAIPQYPHPYIIFWQIKTPDFIFQLLSIISHPFGFILQQTPIQNYINFTCKEGSKGQKPHTIEKLSSQRIFWVSKIFQKCITL